MKLATGWEESLTINPVVLFDYELKGISLFLYLPKITISFYETKILPSFGSLFYDYSIRFSKCTN